MTAPGEPRRVAMESVAIDPDHPRMIIVTDVNGARLFYLQTDTGDLVPGRPVWLFNPDSDYRVRVFVPLAPWSYPTLLEVEPR